MAWRGSLSRSLLSNARASTTRSSSPSLPRLRPTPSTPFHGQYAPSRRLFSSNLLRSGGFLACTQSLLPLYSVVAATRLTSHIDVEACSCCELSQGT